MKGKDLYIRSTGRTPEVIVKEGHIKISGRSIPEDSGLFYEQLLSAVSAEGSESVSRTTIDLNFEYINTSSTSWVFNVIRTVAARKDAPGNVTINWYYEEGDDDMSELGEILKSLVPVPFEIIEIEEHRIEG